MKKIFTLLLLAISSHAFSQHGTQPAGFSKENLDVSNINPTILTGGDAFWYMANAGFEVPRGSGHHTIFAGALWLGGKDQQNNLYLAAQTYRQGGPNQAGYWPGPIAILQDPAHTQKYDKIWKVSRLQVETHQTNFNQPGYVMPPDIATWPGNGNLANGEAGKLAPYIDVNNDGLYTPALGDYPDIKGDQALYLIVNDRGNAKVPFSPAMNVEVHIMHFGFDNPANPAVYNTLFTEYRIINRGQTNYKDMYAGLFTDLEIGSYTDDLVGCDTLTNRYYGYNATNKDQAYGLNPPAQSVMFLDQEMSRFMYFNNVPDPSNGSGEIILNGPPKTTPEYYNYLTGKWRNGNPLTMAGDGTSNQGTNSSFAFPGDPATASGWIDQLIAINTSLNTLQFPDRKGIGSFGPFTLAPGQEIKFTAAYTYSRGTSNLNSVTVAEQDAQTVKAFFNAGMPIAPKPNPQNPTNRLALYPNPAQDQIKIQLPVEFDKKEVTYTITDYTGRKVVQKTARNTENKLNLSLADLKSGVYQITITSEKETVTSKLVKL